MPKRKSEPQPITLPHEFTSKECQAIWRNCSGKPKYGHGVFFSEWDGKPVVVKKFDIKYGPSDEYQKEIEILRLADDRKERNIIGLYGYGRYRYLRMGEYEFVVMPKAINGALYEYITSQAEFSWGHRFEVMIGIAAGVSFLHMHD